MAFLTVNLFYLHFSVIPRGCEVISGRNYKTAPNCLAYMYMLDYTVIQMRKANRKLTVKGLLVRLHVEVAKSHSHTSVESASH